MNNYSDNQMMADIERIIISEEELHEMVARVGAQISRDYNGKNLLMVSVLKGSVMFMADLMRALTIPARIDFMAVSSYGSGTKSSGVVKIAKDLDINLEGYDLLIVEDILDSGKTPVLLTPDAAVAPPEKRENLHPFRQARPPRSADCRRLCGRIGPQ